MDNVKSIISRENPLLLQVRKLVANPGAYRKLDVLWLEGEHLCTTVVQRNITAQHAIITELAWQTPALRQLARHAAKIAVIPAALMAQLSSLDSPPPLGFLVSWTSAEQPQLTPQIPSLVLDRLQDPGNVGNILRSAAAMGFTQVLALQNTVALWSPKVLRAGMGAHFGLQLVEGVTLEALSALKMPMVSTSSHVSIVIHKTKLPWPCAWVFGHEGQGVTSSVAEHCDLTVNIPQPGGEESLNVAAAAAVCLYESARQRA
jgi:RNA methyltransferase, TrmH family